MCLRRALEVDPKSLRASYALALILATHPSEEFRNGAEAIRLVERALQGRPGRYEVPLLDTLAAAYAETGQFDRAVATADQASRLARSRGSARVADVIRRHRLLYEAGRVYRKGERLPPLRHSRGALAHVSMGQALQRSGQSDKAAAHYRAALRQGPATADSLSALATVHYQQGRHADAAALFAQALTLRAADVETTLNLAWLLAATADDRLHDPREALLLARFAAENAPERWNTHDTLAVAYAAAGRFDEAVDACRRAIRLVRSSAGTVPPLKLLDRLDLYQARRPYRESPSTAASNDDRGWARAQAHLGLLALRQGRASVAERQLVSARPFFPDDAALRTNLGEAVLQFGRADEAIGHFRAALQIEPAPRAPPTISPGPWPRGTK